MPQSGRELLAERDPVRRQGAGGARTTRSPSGPHDVGRGGQAVLRIVVHRSGRHACGLEAARQSQRRPGDQDLRPQAGPQFGGRPGRLRLSRRPGRAGAPSRSAPSRLHAPDAHPRPARAKSGVLVEKMYAEAAARAHAVYDSTNIRWLAEHFRRYARSQTLNTEVINLSPSVPTVAPVDTGRILMRMKSRNVSVNQFLHEYRNIPPIQRHRLVSLEPVIFTLNGMFLAPELVALAREDGLDKVPEVTEQLDERREKLMVERMYQDSVMSRVRVTADDRRKYFDQHRQEFRSPATVRYAYVLRYEQAGMDSVVDALEHGASPSRHRPSRLAQGLRPQRHRSDPSGTESPVRQGSLRGTSPRTVHEGRPRLRGQIPS